MSNYYYDQQYHRAYYQEHKLTLKEYRKQYYKANRTALIAKKREKITCSVCEAIICRGGWYDHIKSKKHLKCLSKNNNNVNKSANGCIILNFD